MRLRDKVLDYDIRRKKKLHFSGCLRKMFVFFNLLDLTSCNISMIFAHF